LLAWVPAGPPTQQGDRRGQSRDDLPPCMSGKEHSEG
jgi:hypothetical protein